MFGRKSKVWETPGKNGLFHRTASSCIRRLPFTLGEARGIHGFSPRPRISDISSSLCLSDEIDITIISALSPHRPIFKCRPFHTSQWSIMQAGGRAGGWATSRGIEALPSLSSPGKPPACEAPLQRCKLDLAPVRASSQMLRVAAQCMSANSPGPAALISTGRLLARHLLKALHI